MNVTAVDSQNTLRDCCSCRRGFGINPNNPATSNTLTARLTRPSTIRSVDDNWGTVELSGKIGRKSEGDCTSAVTGCLPQLVIRPFWFNVAHRNCPEAGNAEQMTNYVDSLHRKRGILSDLPSVHVPTSTVDSRQSNSRLIVPIALTGQSARPKFPLQSRRTSHTVETQQLWRSGRSCTALLARRRRLPTEMHERASDRPGACRNIVQSPCHDVAPGSSGNRHGAAGTSRRHGTKWN